MAYPKPMEIFFGIASLPGMDADHPDTLAALDFRDQAMALIENALEAAQAGEWEGADIGMGGISFGFFVQDFDVAQEIARKAVAGTKFVCIRAIVRSGEGSGRTG